MTKADPHNKVHPIPSAHTRVALFIFGFLGLSYEVLSSKVFFEYYSESSQSLALILSIFLVGLAVGSLLYAKYNNTLTKPAVFVTLHIATGIFLCFTLIHIDSIILFVQNFISLESVWNQIVVSLIVLLFPTIVLGTVFPRLLATSINASDEKHKPIGNSNALDLAGSVIGSLTVGFLFIPVLGIAHSILVIFILHVLALLLFIERRKGWYLFLIFYVIALVCGSLYEPVQTVVDDHENIVKNIGDTQILFAEESPFQKVTVQKEVTDKGDKLRLIIGRRQQCDTTSFAQNNVSEIHFVERALKQLGKNIETANIGLGCGLTAGLLSSSNQVKSLDIIEINQKIPDAARFFSAYNHDVLNNPKTNLIIDDGYDYLQNSPKKYDLIAMDVEEPTVLHSSRLYSVENFQHAGTRLREGGVFALWAFKNFDINFTQIIYNSIITAFPHVYVVQSGVYKDMYFLASYTPLDSSLIGQTEDDRALQVILETSGNKETQTLNHNTLARFSQQFLGNY